MKKTEKILKLAVVQQSGYANKSETLKVTFSNIKQAANKGAQLVLLQELHSTYYFCQTEELSVFNLAEPIPGETTQALCNLAKELKIVIVCSIFEKQAPGLFYNTAVVIESNGTIAGKYRKTHIPEAAGYHEKYYFTPGDLGCKPIETSVGKLGVLVCWDQWYPEAARLMALNGAELLLYPTAIGWYPDTEPRLRKELLDRWITIQRAHSIANALPVLVSNRVGLEKDPSGETNGLLFWGNSFITDAKGQIITQAEEQSEEFIIADVNLSQTEEERLIWPFLRDRRVDIYSDLLRKYVA